MISKELLSEVMGYPISKNINECGITRIIGLNESSSDGSLDLDFGYQGLESSHIRYINVYQLAHKCKEWAYNKKYLLDISEDKIKISIQKDLPYYLTTIQNVNQGNNFIPFDPYIDIKACQWIYDNTK